jgi:hypothetical protein
LIAHIRLSFLGCLIGAFKDHRAAGTIGSTGGYQTKSSIYTGELIGAGCYHTGAGGTEWMPDGNGSAHHVEKFHVWFADRLDQPDVFL